MIVDTSGSMDRPRVENVEKENSPSMCSGSNKLENG